MKESEYLNATSLQQLRDMQAVIHGLIPNEHIDEEQYQMVMRCVDAWTEKLYRCLCVKVVDDT